ncbi:outer membrane beta-barrel protein [Arundinibacter roseus]|uniref:outer membrane beta-barrel protein n=1 Tax=Arundinibacter roseus TaxID=2070510 RepID=UPI001E546DD0|nr:outer membrane beta-barrel protein [Arundinibacter roseus]
MFRLVYTEIPVVLLYKANIGKSWRWYGGAGPYAGIGITANTKSDSDDWEDRKIQFTSENQDSYILKAFKRMDYGLNAVLGVEKDNIQVGVNYSYGLMRILPEGNNPDIGKAYNRTLALTVGYWFGE